MGKAVKIIMAGLLTVSLSACQKKESEPIEIRDLTAEDAAALLPDYGEEVAAAVTVDDFHKLSTAEIEALCTGGAQFIRVPDASSADTVTFNADKSMFFNYGGSYCYEADDDHLHIGALIGSCAVMKAYGISYEVYHLSRNAYIFRLMVDGTKTLDTPLAELWLGVSGDNVTYEYE